MAANRLSAEARAKIFKALSDPTRIAIVDALAKHGPMCGTDLAERLGITLALLSHHWDVLVEAGLIRKKRVGQLRICTLDPKTFHEAVGDWAQALPAAAVLLPRAPAPDKPSGTRRATRKTAR
jgi:DNA-binding transcriptional ArsR family regulator